MKYKILEKPSCDEAYDLVHEALRKKATILVFACCKVNYEGRAISELNWGERIIMIKPDGSFLIHQEKKVEPVQMRCPTAIPALPAVSVPCPSEPDTHASPNSSAKACAGAFHSG